MLTNLLNKTCTIQRLVSSQNSIGAEVKNYEDKLTDVPCCLSALSLQESVIYSRTTQKSIFRFFLDYNADTSTINNSDRLIYDGNTYEILSVYNPGARDNHLQIDCLLEI